MSVAQIQEILHSPQRAQSVSAEAQPRHHTLYFTYGNHLHFMEFRAKYQGSQVLGVGYLDNWTWHINALGTQFTSLP
jgi:hypothetical protein